MQFHVALDKGGSKEKPSADCYGSAVSDATPAEVVSGNQDAEHRNDPSCGREEESRSIEAFEEMDGAAGLRTLAGRVGGTPRPASQVVRPIKEPGPTIFTCVYGG